MPKNRALRISANRRNLAGFSGRLFGMGIAYYAMILGFLFASVKGEKAVKVANGALKMRCIFGLVKFAPREALKNANEHFSVLSFPLFAQ
jgi:hypothetical protein